MPVLSTVGAASLRSFGFGLKGAITPAPSPEPPPPPPYSEFIVATGGTVYVDPYDANYKIHQFVLNGYFRVTSCPFDATVQVMAVGGGGAGEYGGGGAGGYVYQPAHGVSVGDLLVSVGRGAFGRSIPAGNSAVQAYQNQVTVALGGGTAIPLQGVTQTSGGSGAGGTDVYGENSSFANGGAGLQPTSVSGGFGNKGAPWFGTGSYGGGGGAGSAGLEHQGGSGITAQICNSLGQFETMCRGGWGGKNGVAYQLPTGNAPGDGGWGGKMNDANGNYLNESGGSDGIVRIRYKFQ